MHKRVLYLECNWKK